MKIPEGYVYGKYTIDSGNNVDGEGKHGGYYLGDFFKVKIEDWSSRRNIIRATCIHTRVERVTDSYNVYLDELTIVDNDVDLNTIETILEKNKERRTLPW